MMRLMVVLVLVLGGVGCASVDKSFYHPDRRVYQTPADDGLTYEEVRFASGDGTMLSGWFIPARGEALGTVIHFHGNAQNMTAHYAMVSWLPGLGWNLFVFDYRGYGASEGRPTRKGIGADCVAAIRYVQSRGDVDAKRIIGLGQSLGGAHAIEAFGNHPFDGILGLVVESPFSSYKVVARDHLGSALKAVAGVLVSDSHSALEAVGKLSPMPLLIIHGTQDPVVPFHHAQRLYERASEPKDLWTLRGAGHTEAFGRYGREVIPRLHQQMLRWVEAAAE